MGEHGDDAKVLAGGQSLIPVMNFRLAQPSVLIDVNGLTDLDFVRRGDDGDLHVGALARQSTLERDPLTAELAPLVHEAVPFIAHPQIRNRGTIGGTLAHADPAAELPVVAVALQARLRLANSGGERWVTADDFYQGLFVTDLGADELVAEVAFPARADRTGWAFVEIARRHGDYALAGVAAGISMDDGGACRNARLVYLGAGERPAVAEQAAATLIGETPSEDAFAAAADTAQQEIEPSPDIHASVDFKRHLARVLTVRALSKAADRAEEAA